jgi:hypothetical protein
MPELLTAKAEPPTLRDEIAPTVDPVMDPADTLEKATLCNDASFAAVTLPSLSFSVVTLPSVGVLASDRRESLPAQ